MQYIRTDKEKHITNSRNVLQPTYINFTNSDTNQNYIAKTISTKIRMG